MTSVKTASFLSDYSYHIKNNYSIKQNQNNINIIHNGKEKFGVVKSTYDPRTGFQAVAVAPIKNGKVDTSKITISYAGTNIKDAHDDLTDLTDVGLGFGGGNRLLSVPDQWNEAQDFASDLKSEYSKSKFDTVGHSLGGALAEGVSALNHWSATTFSAPSPMTMLIGSFDGEAIAWALSGEGRKKMVNYRHSEDVVPALGGFPLGMQLYAERFGGEKQSILGHLLGSYEFDKNGHVVPASITAIASFKKDIKSLDVLKAQLESKGISGGEGKILIDIAQASIIASGIDRAVETNVDHIKKSISDGTGNMTGTWNKGVRFCDFIGNHLSHAEVMAALAGVRCTRANALEKPENSLKKKGTKADKIANDFEKISTQFRHSVNEMNSTDQKVAGMFK